MKLFFVVSSLIFFSIAFVGYVSVVLAAVKEEETPRVRKMVYASIVLLTVNQFMGLHSILNLIFGGN